MNQDKIREAMTLYLVTDRRWLKEKTFEETIKEALQGGVTCIQVREKHCTKEEFKVLVLSIKDLCRQYQVPLIVNDDIDVMLETDVDGIHVGQSDMEASKVRELIGPNKILGVSAHNVEEATKAKENGADYLGVGAIYATNTKTDAGVVSKETIEKISKQTHLPIVAIGGINEKSIHVLKGSSIDGVAVVSAIMNQEDIINKTKQLKQMVLDL